MVHCHACGTTLQGTEQRCSACGMPLSNPTLASGTKLNRGRYSVGRMLGQGGFGITYEGTDTVLNRRLAIKEFFPDGSSRHTGLLVPPTSLGQEGMRGALDAFLDEARTLAQFNHPGIVNVLDVFEENFTAYLVMEYLEGQTLGGRIESQGALPVAEVSSLALTIADALRVVHNAGLLHRDLKPDNIFLTKDGRAVLIDFGSARAYAGGQTVSHTRLVTPGYAPLEQYSSKAKFGPYTDIYALAATLYHAVTGTQPLAATDRLVGEEIPPLAAELPTGLRAALKQGLAIHIDERPQTIDDFVELLQEEVRPQRVPTEAPATPRPEMAGDVGRYDLVLEDPGPLSFLVFRELMRLTGVRYAEVEQAVRTGEAVVRGASRTQVEQLRTQLEAMGARVVTMSAGTAPARSGGTQRPPQPSPTPTPTRPPEPQVWGTTNGCGGFGLGCLLFLLFFLFMSSGSFFFFF